MSTTAEYVIVGGGASGLAAAVFCARAVGGARVLVLEKAPRVGKKLLATGNGTCNISNRLATADRYHGDRGWIASVLDRFSPEQAMAFFESIGVSCITRENGRVYPRCEQAGAVLDCLRLELDALGVTVRCDTPVLSIARLNGGFELKTPDGTVKAKAVFLATGGAAAPALGGGSDCYALPLSLGHTRTPLFPSIVQVKTDIGYIKAMKGLRTDAAVTFCLNGRPLASQTGEVLFTEYGLSGPAVMQISRVVGDWERQKKGTVTAALDLLPDLSAQQVLDELKKRRALSRNGEDFLTGFLHKRIGQTMCRAAEIPLAQSTASLGDAQLNRLCDTVKAFTVTVTGTQGFGGAQVTAGGIATAEVDACTLCSKRVPDLYLLGELLDVDGDCGGFNLQWAWASAYVAATAATGGAR